MSRRNESEQEHLQRWLARHGYRLTWRHATWHECLLSGAGESWVGHGESVERAFEHALQQAFPARLARLALEEALALPRLEVQRTSEVDARTSAGPSAGQEQEQTTAEERGAPQLVREPGLAFAGELAEAAQVQAPSPELAPPTAPSTRRAAARPRLARERALEEGQHILAAIRAAAPEVALWNAACQRLAILSWIARGRDVQNANGEREVKSLVHEIARQLSFLAGRWWPGSVMAMQEATYPAACAAELGLESALETWADVARAAEQQLEALEAEEEADGADENGWWDAGELEPGPPDPAGALREIVRKLEAATGPLAEKAHALVSSAPARDERLRLAKTLRWIRESAPDATLLGDALGRLRWLAWRERDEELASWLDPRRRPLRSWAHELGFDPEKSARRERRRAVLRSLPAESAGTDGPRIAAWLREAFECPDLELQRVASLVQPFTSVVLALAATKEFSPERKHRTKLARLQELLQAPADLPERARLLSEELAEATDASALPLAPARPDPAALLLADILPWTRGRRALLVTNRADPDLDRTLTATLELASLDHEIALPRRIEALAERIEAGRYDLVLSATGFQSHSTSERLEAAARRAAVPCSRIHRARRLACIRALHRDRPGALRAGS